MGSGLGSRAGIAIDTVVGGSGVEISELKFMRSVVCPNTSKRLSSLEAKKKRNASMRPPLRLEDGRLISQWLSSCDPLVEGGDWWSFVGVQKMCFLNACGFKKTMHAKLRLIEMKRMFPAPQSLNLDADVRVAASLLLQKPPRSKLQAEAT